MPCISTAALQPHAVEALRRRGLSKPLLKDWKSDLCFEQTRECVQARMQAARGFASRITMNDSTEYGWCPVLGGHVEQTGNKHRKPGS